MQIFIDFFVDFFELVIIIVTCMDMHNELSLAIEQIRAQIGGRKTVVGAKQLRKALAENSVFCVFLAENADPAITEPILAACQEKNVPFAWAKSMKELGTACGIAVGAAAAAALS